jgi:hypothetical protein
MVEYNMFVKQDMNNVRLQDIEECPIGPYLKDKKGQCSGCQFFGGLDLNIFREGKCKVAAFYKPISNFRDRNKCPKTISGDCPHCRDFLGFSKDSGFYCQATSTK